MVTLLIIFQLNSAIKDEDVINILMPAPFAESSSSIVDRFNEENKGSYKIKVTKGPLETEAVSDLAISSLLLGNSPYDIILIDVTWLPKYVAAGWLTDMSRFISNEEWNELEQGAKLGNQINGKIYRFPFVADVGLLYWRQDLMESPPETPQELIDKSIELTKSGEVQYGYLWQGKQYEGLSCVFQEAVTAFGGEWIDKSGNIQLTSSETKLAANWLQQLISSGASPSAVTNFAETETLQLFESGNAAFMRNWPYAYSELQKETSKVKGKVGITTMVASKEGRQAATLGSWGFSIVDSSDHKAKAYEVIKYLSSLESQKSLFLSNSYTPTKKLLFKDGFFNYKTILPEIKLALDNVTQRPNSPSYAQLSGVLQKELSAILTNQKSIEDALNSAKDKTEYILISSGEIK